jgi:hypothetical protein
MNSFIPSVTVNGKTYQPDPAFTTSAEAIVAVRSECDEYDDHFGSNIEHLNVSFKTPDTNFDTSPFEEANIATAICARGGQRLENVWTAHLIHLLRKTAAGTEMGCRNIPHTLGCDLLLHSPKKCGL